MIPNTKPKPQAVPNPPARTPLASLKAERVKAPWRILMHGMPGVGKTTFGADMPSPIFFCAERSGADELEVVRYPDSLATFEDLRDAIQRLTDEPHEFKSLVIDTIDDLEPVIWGEVMRKDGSASIEEVGGGFQKGYSHAVDEWRIITYALEVMQARRGMNVLLISHTARRDFKNPSGQNFDRWEPNVHKKASGFLVSWCKTVLFVQEEIGTVKLDGAKARSKGVSTGTRIIHTRFNAAYDAKNRHSLPDPLPLDFGEFERAMAAHRIASPDELRASITSQLEALADEKLTGTVTEKMTKAGDDAVALAKIDNRLSALLDEKLRKGA